MNAPTAETGDAQRAYDELCRMTPDEVIARTQRVGHPTEGPYAEALWRALSGPYVFRADVAADLYRRMGYDPFAGYPLVRRK